LQDTKFSVSAKTIRIVTIRIVVLLYLLKVMILFLGAIYGGPADPSIYLPSQEYNIPAGMSDEEFSQKFQSGDFSNTCLVRILLVALFLAVFLIPHHKVVSNQYACILVMAVLLYPFADFFFATTGTEYSPWLVIAVLVFHALAPVSLYASWRERPLVEQEEAASGETRE
jgi:hypothetical protein